MPRSDDELTQIQCAVAELFRLFRPVLRLINRCQRVEHFTQAELVFQTALLQHPHSTERLLLAVRVLAHGAI